MTDKKECVEEKCKFISIDWETFILHISRAEKIYGEVSFCHSNLD